MFAFLTCRSKFDWAAVNINFTSTACEQLSDTMGTKLLYNMETRWYNFYLCLHKYSEHYHVWHEVSHVSWFAWPPLILIIKFLTEKSKLPVFFHSATTLLYTCVNSSGTPPKTQLWWVAWCEGDVGQGSEVICERVRRRTRLSGGQETWPPWRRTRQARSWTMLPRRSRLLSTALAIGGQSFAMTFAKFFATFFATSSATTVATSFVTPFAAFAGPRRIPTSQTNLTKKLDI